MITSIGGISSRERGRLSGSSRERGRLGGSISRCRACFRACAVIIILNSQFLILNYLTSCSSAPTAEEMASLAAKGYYRHLVAGEVEQYIEGRADADSTMPADYREELLTAYKQFVARMNREHAGVRDVRIMNAKADTLTAIDGTKLPYVNVFLVVCFGDSTNEEIVVSMVSRDGKWRMK